MPRHTTPRTPHPAPHFWWFTALPLLFFLALPLVALLWRTPLAEMGETLRRTGVGQAVRLSLWTSSVTVLLTFVLGTPVAYLLARPQFRCRNLLDTLIDLPTVLPPAVAGVALLMAFGRRGLVGGMLADWGVTLAFTPVAVIMAQLFVAGSLYVKSAAAGFARIEKELEEAARLDGAEEWAVFRYLLLPLSRGSLLTGLILTWARALGEFGATIIFAGNFPGRTQTMPLAIYLGFELDLNVALVLAAILLCLSATTLIVVKKIIKPI